MKRFVCTVLVSALCLSFIACPRSSGSSSAPASTSQSKEQPKVVVKAHWNEPLERTSHPASLYMNRFKEEIEKAAST